MDLHQPTAPVNYPSAPASPGIFGSRIPSSVCFAVALLLLLLPLAEIKCSGRTVLNQTGLGFALAKDWKSGGGFGGDMMGELTSKTSNIKKGNTQYFAAGAIALGVIGLLVSLLAGSKAAVSGGIISGILATGCLVALLFEVKKGYSEWLAKEASDKAVKGAESIGLRGSGETVGTTLAFTPWFYVAIAAFLAAAFLCYRRIPSSKN